MRIITWNCGLGFVNKKKASILFAKDPDIAIVQECSRSDAVSFQHEGYSNLWFGKNLKKGLAVFYKSEWTIRQLAEPDQKWIVPLEVKGPEDFTLVAVWAWSENGGISSYVRLIRESLAAHSEWFDNGPVVMAGDFNSNSRWDKAPNGDHSSLIATLVERGLVSAYHSVHSEEHGLESRFTFFQNRKSDKSFHIDYIFIPIEWIERLSLFEVGNFDQWSGLSDHCPLSIDLSVPIVVEVGIGKNWRDIK